jgi:hypothetical protein
MNANVWLEPPGLRGVNGHERFAGTTPSTLPADLREWVNESIVVGWVLREVSEALSGHSPWAWLREDGPPPATMLTVLTYCYATGLYASEDIEAATMSDPIVRYLCANQFVTSAAIRRFRRAHRESLRACLLQLHRRAWQHRFGARPGGSWAAEPPCFGPPQEEAVTYRLAAAAETRIQQAILADTMDMDV